MDPVTGRLFSFDLNAVCSEGIFSDDEGATWQHSFPCANPVNDHLTLLSAPAGAAPTTTPTSTYPRMLYYCFNRVGDSSCERSSDGGLTYVPTSPAFTGSDPNAGSVCGGLTGQLAADSAGRIFLPKGHCGLPWVAISTDGGESWTRVKITGNTPMADHEVSLAVDTADNIYAVWRDGTCGRLRGSAGRGSNARRGERIRGLQVGVYPRRRGIPSGVKPDLHFLR